MISASLKSHISKLLIIALAAVIMTTVVGGQGAHAASCQSISGKASGGSTTFYVTTDSGWWMGRSVTLTQSKATVKYLKWIGKGKSYNYKSFYATYYVTVRNIRTGRIHAGYNGRTWNSKNLNIGKLDKNTKYKITVTPLGIGSYGRFSNEPVTGKSRSWSPASTWEIRKVRNISLCR